MNHFHFPTSNLEKTRNFYESHFGFKEVKRLGQTLVLVNSKKFVLAMDATEVLPKVSQNSHLGFALEGVAEVESLYQKLKKEGVEELSVLKNDNPNAVHFYCKDPAGNRLEIGWYRF